MALASVFCGVPDLRCVVVIGCGAVTATKHAVPAETPREGVCTASVMLKDLNAIILAKGYGTFVFDPALLALHCMGRRTRVVCFAQLPG